MLLDESEQTIYTIFDLALRNILKTSWDVYQENIKVFDDLFNKLKIRNKENQITNDDYITKKFSELFKNLSNKLETTLRTNRKKETILYSQQLNLFLTGLGES